MASEIKYVLTYTIQILSKDFLISYKTSWVRTIKNLAFYGELPIFGANIEPDVPNFVH